MSSQDSGGQGDSASQHQAFDHRPLHEGNIDPDLSSSLDTDSNNGSGNVISGQQSQVTTPSPASTHKISSTPRHSTSMQSTSGSVPQTPTSMKRQNTANSRNSLVTPQKPNYDSPSNQQKLIGGPFTPSNYGNGGFTNGNSPYDIALNPLSTAAGNNSMQRVPSYNSFMNTPSRQVPRSFENMNSTPQQRPSSVSFNQVIDMLDSQSSQGHQTPMGMTDMSQQRRFLTGPFSQNESYESIANDIGAGNFGSSFIGATRQHQGQNWSVLGHDTQQSFSGGHAIMDQNFQFQSIDQLLDNAQYPSPTALASQGVKYQFEQQNTIDFEDEEVDEYQDDDDDDEASDYEAGKDTPSTSNTESSSARTGRLSKYQGIIKSESDYKALLAKRAKAAKDSVSRGRLDTGPTDNEEILDYISQLFDAFMNTDGIVDKKAQDGRKAQAARRVDDDYYSAEVIEIACWELFFKCRQASKGIKLVDAYHNTKREGSDIHETFKKRWDAIVNACRHSKAVCKQVLDPLYNDRLVDAPETQFQMKLNNKKINAERDKQNRLGRLAIKNGVSLTDIPGIVKVEEDEDAIVTPSKRPARQRGSAIKRRTQKQIKYDPDEEEEDGDPTYETPVKKARANAISVSSRSIRTPRQKTPRKVTTSSTKTKKGLEQPSPTPQLEMEYCLAICNLLNISSDFAGQFTLEQLRTFARPYNHDQLDVPWYHESFVKGQRGVGHKIFHANGKPIPHFTWKLRDLQVLAIARGELGQHGELITDHEVQHYTVGADTELKKILGITFNPFRLIMFNQPPPQEASS